MAAESGEKLGVPVERASQVPRGVAIRISPSLTAAVIVALAAAALRGGLLIGFPFDGLYGQDAYFYLSATRQLVDIWTDQQKLWEWLTVAGTPPVSLWPLGYHAQMALMSLVTGPGPASGQVVSYLAGVLTPVWTSLLVIATWRWSVDGPTDGAPRGVIAGAIFAGLIVAFSSFSVRASVVVMSDMAGLQWATIGALLAVLYLASSGADRRLGWLGGVCLALAGVTRYIYPLLLLAIAICAFVGLREGRRADFRLSHLARLLIPLVLPSIMLVGLQFAHNALHPMPRGPSAVVTSWNPLNALGRIFDSPDGHLNFDQPMGYFFLVRPLVSPQAIGLPVLPLFAAGVVALLRWPRKAPALLLGGWWLLFALFYSGNVFQADRYVLSYLTPMAVVAGLGVAWLTQFQGGRWRTSITIPLALLASAAVPVLASRAIADYRELQAGKADYLRAALCLRDAAGNERVRPAVYTFSVTGTVRYYTDLTPRELFFETPATLRATLENAATAPRGYLLLPPIERFEEQWGRTSMGESYRFLRDNYNLAALPCEGTSFTLFAVR